MSAFQSKKGNALYSSEFKTLCAEAILSGEGCVNDIFEKHNISSRKVLRDRMYKQLGISRSGHYKWLHWDIPVLEQEYQELAEF